MHEWNQYFCVCFTKATHEVFVLLFYIAFIFYFFFCCDLAEICVCFKSDKLILEFGRFIYFPEVVTKKYTA